jgi:predicted DNA binding CopG/RHH family protein
MLSAMQTTVDNSESHSAASFSALLAALSSPAPKPATAWPDDGLADDIATLSYEQALRTHARHRSNSAPTDRSHTAYQQTAQADERSSAVQPLSTREPTCSSTAVRPAGLEEDRKSASVTIRLGAAESARLHARAAEAGLTVSAYLRSCIFEVEELRAQVKQTLAQMRTAPQPEEREAAAPVQAPSTCWQNRIFPRWVLHRAAAHA